MLIVLAAQWAERTVVLHGGAVHSDGPPATVLTPAMLAEVYLVEARIDWFNRGGLMVLIDHELP